MEHSFNKVIDLLFLARKEGVELVMNDERLQLKVGANKAVDETLLKEIRNNKQLIIDYLKSHNWQATRVNKNNNHKIIRFDRESLAHIPLSFSQERLWFIDHLEGSVQYHSPTVMRLTGNLNKDALLYAIKTVIRRQDALRTVFHEIDGKVYQSLKTNEDWELRLVDGSTYNEDAGALKLYIEKLVKEPFDLANDYPIRGSLIRLGEQEHMLVVTMHHIASDAWSVSIIVKEVAELYNSFVQGREANLAPLPVQYADFAVWQRNYLQGAVLEKKISYWKNKLEGQEPLQLPTDHNRPPVKSTRGASAGFKIEKELAGKLYELSRQQGVSLFMLLLATFKVLLQRYSSQEDISVGTSIASRQQEELEGLVGFFVNTLALRTEFSSDITFIALLEKVKSTTLEAYEHQDIPFDKVVEVAVKERDPSRTPLFQVMLVLQNTPEASKLQLGEVELSGESFVTNIAKFDITFFITETPNGFLGSVDYSTDLYQAATMKQMTGHFTTLLSSVVADPQQKIGLLTMLSNKEEQQLLEQFNSAAVVYPKDKTVVGLFEEQVAKTPGNVAVVFEKEELSYRELNECSNQLAHYLKSRGVKPGSLVPLFMERSASMIVGLLGIMKAGAAYVPIDTDFPADRISYMLQDAGAAIIVSSKGAGSSLEVAAGVEIIEVEDAIISLQPSGNLPAKPSANHLAYVIYTSGSTGRPKGVMIEHCSLVDYYYGLNKYIQIDQCSSFALVSTIATDLGNTVIYGSLLSGGSLHVFAKESVSNIEYLHRYFREEQIECVKIVPSHWKALSTTEELLLPAKLLIFGGETLQAENVAAISMSDSSCRVVNHYGPTETTVGKLLYQVQPGGNYEKRIPVGKPFSNTQVYVLSKDMQLCPIGVPGKLYIAGDGVARGYFNNRELTEEKFITDPFSPEGRRRSRMYATGDLVKWLPDGNIEFMARVDNQVQIRGYRVEPGEIESVLEQSGLVKQGVVLAKLDRQGNNRLVAYIVARDEFDREGIVDYLKKKLPEYMIPGVLIEMERLPLTANGKINRKALPDPDTAEATGDEYIAPRNETEEKLAGIWAEVLEVEQIGVHDDFFELGGHSLLAVRLISAMRKAFRVEMPIGDIFEYPTVALLSARLAGKGDAVVLPSVEPVNPRPEHIPLSFSQERLWFIDRMGGSQQYHVPIVLRLTAKLNKAALESALQNVVNRHEVLRTTILEQEGRPYQSITGKNSWQLSVIDGSVYKDDQEGLQRYIQQLISAPFDLSKDYMMRAHLIAFNEEEHVLVFTLHHIASDGWSRSILVKEVVEGYSAYEDGRLINLPVLPVQYADYAIWQQNYLQGDILEKKLGYWKEKLQELTPLQLPTDYSRPTIQSARGAATGFGIDEGTLKQLHELSTQQGVTLFMTLLAAFNVLLHRYSGQQDICVGTPIAGRQQQELEELIGFFVNTLALRSRLKGNISFTDLLQQIKTTTLEAYEHQEVPFEKVVDSVVTERDLSRNPLFQVMLILRNTPDVPELNLGEVRLAREFHQYSTTLFDISLFITETAYGLQCSIEYSTDLYTEATISRMTAHFKELLHSIVEKPEQQIALLPMVSAEEKQQLLVDFNDTKTPYPVNKSIVDLFEEQVARTPHAVAVVFEKRRFSFAELNRRANQLAHYLAGKGIGKEMLVPVCIERSPEMMVAILGILKTGAAFVPIDPEYPVERIHYLVANTSAEIVISNQESRIKLPSIPGLSIIQMDNDWPLINKQPAANLKVRASPHHLAYVIYTSGSTGMPKGVLIEQGGVVNLLKSIDHTVGFTAGSGLLSVTTFSFDIFYLECFMPLVNGGKLIIVSREIATNGFKLAASIHHYQPTHVQATPATWQLLLDAGWGNKEEIKILIGGEAIKEEIKDALTKIGDVYNLYGPTETTIWSATKKLATDETVRIGKPVANTSIYIVGEAMQLVPVGVAGEICIGGAGLARGYLNRPDLTAQKFIANPFSDEPGSRIYRTGDLGRWLPDGNLECLGRIDDQVKIRGYRIELGEIESVLMESELVNQAVVLVKEDNDNNKRLIGYYVPKWATVKEKEPELYAGQVEGWKEIYETEYALSEAGTDEEFDINIWKDSFTGEPIAAGQMQEWLQDIVAVILSEKTGNVLEIGSGTGLIYYQLAGKVNKYIGTDFSGSSINQIQKRIQKGVRDYGPTEFMVCAAHEVFLREEEQVDTIIMNSVVQYFPGEQYMDEVMGKCIAMLKGSGRIIIGDVRDYRLLKLFKGRLQMQNMGHSVNIREFNWAVEQEVLKEEELLFSPEYFYRLPSIYPQISHVELKWKEGVNINELTLYRYTAIIHVGPSAALLEPVWQNWNEPREKQTVIRQLEERESLIALQNVPNFRLWQERLLNKALSEKTVSTIGDLINITAKEDEESLEVKNLIGIAKAKGYYMRLLLHEDPLKVNLLLEPTLSGLGIRMPHLVTKQQAGVFYTNIPLFSDISLLLQKKLKALLKQRLPEYMVPSELVALSELPLTNNGKIDRRFLSLREEKTIGNKLNYQPPQTTIEIALAEIWQELLGIGRVGIHDNFFDLGGHSLLAMRAVAAVRKKLDIELLIKDIFVFDTIGKLATHLEAQSAGLLLPAIEVQPRPERVPLSFSQERLWFIDRLQGSVQYHLPAVLQLKGRLDAAALSNALLQIINRHEVLRTVIREEEGAAYQHVKEADSWQLQIVDGSIYKNDPEGLQQFIRNNISASYDLSADYMLRAALISLDENSHILVVTLHHIASDGWSISIIVRELAGFYNSQVEGREARLPVLPVQYVDYALWQRKYLQGEAWDKKLQYWKDKLQGAAPLQLSTDYSRPPVQSTNGAFSGFKISKELSDELQALSQQQGTTLFMTLLAVFNVLLYRYSGQPDICVGTPIAGRQQQELEGLIGFFINTLALRSEVDGNIPFTDLLHQVKATMLEAYDHQEIPFEKVVEAVVKERDMSRSPLFQVMLVLQNTPEVEQLHLGQLQLSRGPAGIAANITSKFDITFYISETVQGLTVGIEYCTDLYHEATIRMMADHFNELLHSVVKAPQQTVDTLPMLNSAEKNQLLVEFNDTKTDNPGGKTMIDLFEEQVAATPEGIALVSEEHQFSYQALNTKANQLAHYLRSKGVQEETLVPVCIERSAEMIIAILGILKAGAAYVPIDPEYPAERIGYMLQDTAATIVISSKKSRIKVTGTTILDIVEIDGDSLWQQPAHNPAVTIASGCLAYVIYTSGSTGKPKGVMVEHSNLYSFICWCRHEFSSSHFDMVYATTSICFDLSVFEIFYPLSIGKPVRVLSDGLSIGKYLPEDSGVLINTVPVVIRHLLQEGTDLSHITVINMAGEPIPVDVQQNLELEKMEVRNLYGPTEDTTYSTVFRLQKNQPVLIGKPISNTTVHILNKAGGLVPIGVAGEIGLGGAGVTRGYLNQEALTAEKFTHNPFGSTTGARMYKTGDLGRWLRDGNIEYLGRIDEQVKIRGYRIELGEIEDVLLKSGLAIQAAVLARDDEDGYKRLVGYIVPKGRFDNRELISYLQNKLPGYMVPSLWVELEELPLTPNGKIDKKALPDPDVTRLLSNRYISPRNDLEIKLAGIWQELLGVDRVGIDDNFFGLGGDSIMTIQVVSRARRVGYELQPKDIFINQTIRQLSAGMAERAGLAISGEQGVLTGLSGLLPIQQWYLESGQTEISHFNQSVLLGIKKSVTEPVLREAVKQLIIQHDALRFRYYQTGDQWYQEYEIGADKFLTEDLLSASDTTLRSLITERAEKYQRSLDIKKGELIQVVWMQTPDEEAANRLLIVIHHLVVDGVSWRILLGDLELLLTELISTGKTTPEHKSSSYRQWYHAVQNYGKSQRLLTQKGYWQQIAESYHALPVDKQYTEKIRTKDFAHYSIRLEVEQTRTLLQEVPRTYHTQINDILLASLAKTLCDWSNRNSVVIGLEGHGREDVIEGVDTSQTVGWFTTLFPLILRIDKEMQADHLIKSVKEQLRGIPDRGLGYGVLKYINKEETLQGPEPWDIIFNYLGQLDNVIRESEWFSPVGESAGAGRSREYISGEKLAVNGHIQDGKLVLNWSYSSRHYEHQTIADVAQTYLSNLELLIRFCTDQQKAGITIHTPSDYGLNAEVSYQELDRFLEEPFKGSQRKEWIEGMYRLSGLQEGILFHNLYQTVSGSYMEQFSCDLARVDVQVFRNSWEVLLRHHSILRSGFYYDTFSVPVQCVYTDVELPVEVLDYRGVSREDQETLVNEFKEADILRGFNFKAPPLMRITLMQLSEDRYKMLWTFHHILIDGWSMPVLIEEFLNVYELLAAGRQVEVMEEDRYEDYIRYLERRNRAQEEAYWRMYLEGVEQSTLLPFIATTSERTKGQGIYKMEYLQIDTSVTARLQSYAQRYHLTVNSIMQGVWSYLLHSYTGSNNIVYGVTVSGRPDDLPGVEKRVGMYINTLPLHSRFTEGQGVTEWLQDLQNSQVASRDFQYTPLHQIQVWTGVQGDLFDSLLVFENYPVSKVISTKEWKLQVQRLQVHEQTNYPLTILIGSAEQINIKFNYNADILKPEHVSKIKAHFGHVLLQMIDDAEGSVNDLKLITASEEDQLLHNFNNTSVAYPADKSISDLFEEQVLKSPEAIAVVFEGEKLTYRYLNERSNQLAHYLKSRGAGAEMLIPICIERSPEMVIGVLGILKAGAAYVPLDPDYPAERISYMVEDCNASIIVSSKAAGINLPTLKSVEIIQLDKDNDEINRLPVNNVLTESKPERLAYVLYTSGSTGIPKGVQMQTGSLVNLLNWQQKQFENNRRHVLQFASLNFDVSFQEIFSTLCFGSTLYLISSEDRNDLNSVLKDIEKYSITHLFIPYIVLENLAAYIRSAAEHSFCIEEIMVAGEQLKLTDDILNMVHTNKVRLINQYGPTEAHVVSSYIIDSSNTANTLPPIGKPIDNTSLYIIGNNGKLNPVEVAGEICIGGVQVARGYLNRDELTAAKFVADPFSNVAGAKMYKTGDLGRWLPDGNMEYLGRADDQVKIRGHRVELGEIESLLQQSELVSQAVVLAKEDSNGNKNLVAYVVPAGAFDQQLLIAYLRPKLPDYMVPALWVEVVDLPVTNNGKIDKKALLNLEVTRLLVEQYEAPRNELETKIAEIWQDLLGVKQVGIYDNFFDLGGHSLYAIRLVWQIQKKVNVNVTVNDIFIYPTVAGLAGNIVNKVQNPSLPDVNIKYLVPIKTTGKKPPLYLVAGGGGTALKIKKFANLLDAEQPVYVFQPPIGSDALKEFPDTIEGIAKVFIEELLIQNPEGPYALSGHCIGGIIAFEMAKQLQLRGKKVHSLAMFDTIIRRRVKTEPGAIKNLYHIPSVVQKSLSKLILKVNFQTYLLRKHPRQSILYKVNTFRSIRNRIKRKNFKTDYLKYAGIEIFDESIDIYINAYRNYTLLPYNGKMTLFYATDRYFFLDRNNNIGYKKMHLDENTKNVWKDYATGISIYEIKGEHSDIFSLIHGEEFAQTLQRHLDHP